MEKNETTKGKILFVDDDEFFLNLYSQKALRYHVEMRVAKTASEALDKLSGNFVPDVLMIDLDMPILNGFELIDEIRKRQLAPKAHIVILTNKNEPYYIEKAKKYKISSYIVKATRVPSEVMNEVMLLMHQPQ